MRSGNSGVGQHGVVRLKQRIHFGYCVGCGKLYSKKRAPARKYCTHRCFARHRGQSTRGEAHPNYKGRIARRGYIALFRPGHPMADSQGYALEHRLVMARHLGRMLKRSEVVHHKNGKKRDNRIANLELHQSQSSHINGHLVVGTSVVNQYGTWPVLTPAQRKEKQRERNRRRYH